MDPDETDLDPPSIENISHQTIEWPLNSSTANTADIRAKRKSLRVRPPQPLENAEPPSALNVSFKPAAPSTAPKMSLFHLFSRPKVERQRGYAEKGVDTTWQPQPGKPAAAPTPNLVVHVQPPGNNEGRAQYRAQARAQTPMSLQTDSSKPTPKVKWKEPPPRDPAERRNGVFEPPPLFQAYPQSVKDGTLEVSDMSPEAMLHKAKGKRSKADTDPLGDAQSYKTRKSTKSNFKHVGNGASVNVELPPKIFVLVTSGYLLQYSETGPSDRLPERMLQLGKESAAFACDLLPGKHHVLQVSQAVDQEGVIVASSGSIFSKLGIRSAAAKRMTNGFLLVMPSGKEMESWMSALRQEIEHLGGKKIRPEAAVRPKTGDHETELKKTPSQSHRYQIKRNPSKVTSVTSPATSATNLTTETAIKVPSPTQSGFLIPSPTISAFQVPSPSRSPKIEEEKEEDSDTATIDGIDMEASKLKEEGPSMTPRNRATSDAPSISSSAVVSVEHQQLNNVRNSFSNSTRTSHTSQAGTVTTATGTSPSNSLVGSPPSPGFFTGSLEAARDNVAPLKAPYRPLASAGYSINRRRSAVPLPNSQNGQALPALNTSPAKPRQSVIVESTVGGQQFPSPPRSRSPQRRLSAIQSAPNLKASASRAEKHDSKISTPPIIPTSDDDDERPESFVGDLPPPSTWSSTRAPTRRTSLMQPPPMQPLPPTRSPPAQPQPDTIRPAEISRPNKRMSFSMPLKVNPQVPTSVTPPTNNRRRSQLGAPEPAGEQPIVHTLTAKVDSFKRISIHQYQSSPSLASLAPNGGTIIPKRASVSQFHSSSSLSDPNRLQRSSFSSPGPRLSLFPSPIALPASGPPEPPQRSSSATTPTANSQTLRRPTSMQVRSDHAPFLQSIRNSTGPLEGRAVPIRGMRPSRSPSPSPAYSAPPTVSAFSGLKFNTPTLSEESDEATPLPERALSPLPPPRPGSRSGGRKGSRRSSALPELDLGIPVVGLGPPAPPPSAPLPAPPPASRTTSPVPTDGASANWTSRIDNVAGLGIRVS